MLSGSLSTHNGSGGGNINVTVRRVLSAKGWGEVHTNIHAVIEALCCLLVRGRRCLIVNLHVCLCLQVEFGAGDVLGPLVGLKVFRNITPRW